MTHELLIGKNRSMFGVEFRIAPDGIVVVPKLKRTAMNSTRSLTDVLSSRAGNFRTAWKRMCGDNSRAIHLRREDGLCYNLRPEGNEMQMVDRLKPLGLLVLRLGVAAIFLSTGYDKLFGAPGKWLAWFPKQGFPSYFAYIAGSLELFGGFLLVLGLLTRITGLLLAIQMAIAVWKVSLPHSGIYNVEAYGLPLMLGVACFALFTVGAGMLSVDGATFERTGKAKAKA
jgi:putative oxidoreductase